MNTNNTINQLETEAALDGKKLVCGVALNDIKGSARRYGKNTIIYSKWAGAVHRSHDVKEGKNPTYADCTLHESWRRYSNFIEWYEY